MRPHRPARQPLRLYRLRPAAHVALAPSPAKAGGGWGGVSSKISANREHPLPASPCLRRGRGQDKSSRLKPLLPGPARQRSTPRAAMRRENSHRQITLPPTTTGNARPAAPLTEHAGVTAEIERKSVGEGTRVRER